MRLSRDEERFLRHWIYDEAHYQDGPGPAKRLQLQHRAIPADLAAVIAAALPDAIDQEEAGLGPPPVEPPTWPWSEGAWRERVSAARAALAQAASEPETEPNPAPHRSQTAGTRSAEVGPFGRRTGPLT